jgi:hypothetical protein
VVLVNQGIGAGALPGPVQCPLGAPVPVQQIGGDAVEPGQRAPRHRLEAVATLERGEEGLRSQVVGEFPPDPAGEVPVHLRHVPVVDLAEALGIGQRLPDRRAVVAMIRAGSLREHLGHRCGVQPA